MKIYYDCEFIEDGHTIDLISIGMVAEDGREYYAISSEFDHAPLLRNQWLVENVLPSLPYVRPHERATVLTADFDHPDRSAVKPRWRIADDIRNFVLTEPDPQLWAWYGAYDHVALCQLFGAMIALPEGFPMWTNDLKQECERLGNPQLPEQSDGVHNALADARHNKVRAEYLTDLAAKVGV